MEIMNKAARRFRAARNVINNARNSLSSSGSQPHPSKPQKGGSIPPDYSNLKANNYKIIYQFVIIKGASRTNFDVLCRDLSIKALLAPPLADAVSIKFNKESTSELSIVNAAPSRVLRCVRPT
jgi:hypothetical protein